jgi:hypothetical protein
MALPGKRFCVFCGKQPESKTREHVVPYWLLEMTGDPKRVVTLGIDYAKEKKPISFAWQAFVMPACDPCNNHFSAMEQRVKATIQSLERREALSVAQYDELLDWLDKVRVGVWLARRLIENHPIPITPNFHITSRMGQKDRMLALYAFDGQPSGINLFGNDSIISNSLPSCFGLRINNLLLVNISSDFFCSEGCGLPHPLRMKLLCGGENSGMLSLEGVGYPREVSHPVTNLKLFKPVVWLYQPIKLPSEDKRFIGGYFGQTNLFDTRLMGRTLGGEGKKGAIFRQWQDRVEVLNQPDQMIELDEVVGKGTSAAGDIVASVYDAQVQLFEAVEEEWVGSSGPSDFDRDLRALKIESTKGLAEFYRNPTRGRGSNATDKAH